MPDVTPAGYAAMLAAASGGERLQRALALSAYARALSLAGARQHVGASGRAAIGREEAVAERYLRQLYGADAPRVLALLNRPPIHG